ncbi:MAG: HEAT repeat domain-containing protein [Elusimicrobiota bacterium]
MNTNNWQKFFLTIVRLCGGAIVRWCDSTFRSLHSLAHLLIRRSVSVGGLTRSLTHSLTHLLTTLSSLTLNPVPLTLFLTLLLITSVPVFAQEQKIDVKTKVAQLKSKEIHKKLEAIGELGKSKQRAAKDALVSELKAEKNALMKSKIVEALTTDQDKKSTDEIVNTLKTDPSPDVRYSAVRSLGFSKDASVVPVLIETFTNEKEDLGVRLQAANSLTKYPDDNVFDVFVKALDNAQPEIRKQALVSLYLGFGHNKERVLPHINRMLKDKETEKIARQYLQNLGVKTGK